MRSIESRTLLAAALAALAIGATTAQAASLLPPVQKSGTVEYLIGGIGQDEARAIEGEASFAGKTLQKNAFVRPGRPLRSVFLWPAGTGEPRS